MLRARRVLLAGVEINGRKWLWRLVRKATVKPYTLPWGGHVSASAPVGRPAAGRPAAHWLVVAAGQILLESNSGAEAALYALRSQATDASLYQLSRLPDLLPTMLPDSLVGR